jgi:hypothetical protein
MANDSDPRSGIEQNATYGHNARACMRHLDLFEIPIAFNSRSCSADSALLFALPEKERWAALAAESILTGLRAIDWQEWTLAARCWAQACEYRGRNGGFLPASLSDALGALRNACERRIYPDGQEAA